jgi:O-antigen ligase
MEITLKEIYFFYIVFGFYTYIFLTKMVKPFVIVLILAAIMMSLSSILSIKSFNLADIIVSGSTEFRTGGIISNVNALSGFIVVAFPFFISLFLQSKNPLSKISLAFGILIALAGVLSTISRSAGLSILIGTIFYFYHYKKIIARKILLLVIIFVILILMLPTREIIFTILRIDQGFSQRNFFWELSFDMFKDNWLFGVGPGLWGQYMFNYSPVLQDSFVGYLFYDVNKLTEGFNNSHNYYLLFATDLGIGGFLLSIFLPFIFFKVASKNLLAYKSQKTDDFLLNLALMTVGASMFVRAIFEGISIITFGWVAIDLPFWTVVAIINFYYNKISENSFINQMT